MLLLGLLNNASQTLLTNGLVNLGSPYRKYCKKCNGVSTFTASGTSVSLNQSGIYHVTVKAVASGTAAGNVTLQLNSNGLPLPGASSTETITTATTELRTFVIDYYIKVDTARILCETVMEPQSLTITNTGIGATILNIVTNIDKVV